MASHKVLRQKSLFDQSGKSSLNHAGDILRRIHMSIFSLSKTIVTETMANYLRSHITTKSVKETMSSKNLC